jgi:hypothetical protein
MNSKDSDTVIFYLCIIHLLRSVPSLVQAWEDYKRIKILEKAVLKNRIQAVRREVALQKLRVQGSRLAQKNRELLKFNTFLKIFLVASFLANNQGFKKMIRKKIREYRICFWYFKMKFVRTSFIYKNNL